MDEDYNKRLNELHAKLDLATSKHKTANKELEELRCDNNRLYSELKASDESITRLKATIPENSLASTINVDSGFHSSNSELEATKLKLETTKARIAELEMNLGANTAHGDSAQETKIISGTTYKVLGGENAGFLQGSDGLLHIRDDAACREYTILREDKKYCLNGCVKDEDVTIEGEVHREVIMPGIGGSHTGHILVQRSDVIREGGREYTVFDAIK